jgi:hypothetical protein
MGRGSNEKIGSISLGPLNPAPRSAGPNPLKRTNIFYLFKESRAMQEWATAAPALIVIPTKIAIVFRIGLFQP